MPAKNNQGQEIGMRHVREILRLGLSCKMSSREIGRSLRVGHTTAQKYLKKARKSGVDWAMASLMTDEELISMVKARPIRDTSKPLPDFVQIHHDLKKPSVTLTLLWQEYKEAHPDGYQLTQFCQMYHEFTRTLRVTLRQTYEFGSVIFVDYAGQTVPVHDRDTGRVWQAQIFVAVLGASNYAYAEATADQGLESWVGSHVHAFEYFDGVTGKVVPDNPRVGVTRACRYEPELNRTYVEMITHYGTAVIPARVRKPQDKAKVENGVLLVERWILAALRNHKFFSLAELNKAIGELLVKLNVRKFQKLPGSRKSVYEEFERKALKPLPATKYEFAQWKKARVNMDYHIELEGHYYSVPYQLLHQEVLVRYTAGTVEVLHGSKRVASHARDYRRGMHTTIKEHMPRGHQEHLSWTPTKIIETARKIGPQSAAMVEAIMNSRQHPEQGYRASLGIIRLGKTYTGDRLEAACARGLKIGAFSYRSIASILNNGLDQKPVDNMAKTVNVTHENIRGSEYFI